MPFSESFILKVVALPVAGLGAIYLTASGTIAPEAGTAILASLIAFVVGDYNGRRTATKRSE